MSTSNVIRARKLHAASTPTFSIKSRASGAWRRFTRSLFSEPVVGNPLHEAWSADGEPLERITPDEMAKSHASRHLVVPHGQGR